MNSLIMISLGLFGATFLASTVLPFSSEFALSGAVLAGIPSILALIIATIGNSLGSITTYYLGRLGKINWLHKYCRTTSDDIEKAKNRIGKYGYLGAFLTFLPIIGDIFAIALGFMRYPFLKFIIYMTAGKFLRYSFWLFLHQYLSQSYS